MEIILVRHGKAEKKQEDLDDRKRKLTNKGIKEFQQLTPELKDKLKPLEKEKIALWSSPARRALETAHIIAQDLLLYTLTTEEFIYAGDFEQLSQKIQQMEVDHTIFVVGHEPALSVWTEAMTGKEMKIRKGDMLSFNVTSSEPLKAELQWVISHK